MDVRHIKAISFDGDMTLWDFEKVMRHSLRHALVEIRRLLPMVDQSMSRIDFHASAKGDHPASVSYPFLFSCWFCAKCE